MKLQFCLLHQTYNVHIHNVQCYISAGRFADLKEILDQQLQPCGFLFQNVNIMTSLLGRQILILQKVHISDDGCQRRLQVMRYVGDQVRFHFLAFYLFVHSLLEAALYLGDLAAERFKYAQFLRNRTVQVALGKLVGCVQQSVILFLQVIAVFPQKEEQCKGVNDQCSDAPDPHQTDKSQYDKVDQYHFDQNFCGIIFQIDMEHTVVNVFDRAFCPGPDAVNDHPFLDVSFRSYDKDGSDTSCRPVAHCKDKRPPDESPEILKHRGQPFGYTDAVQYIVNRFIAHGIAVHGHGKGKSQNKAGCYEDQFKRYLEYFLVSQLQRFDKRQKQCCSGYQTQQSNEDNGQIGG